MKKNPNAQKIKAMLTMKSIKFTDIAKTTGNSSITVGTIVNYFPEKKSLRIQTEIARVLGESFEKLWGEKTDRQHGSIITRQKMVVND